MAATLTNTTRNTLGTKGPYLEELRILADIGCTRSCYGALLALRCVYRDGIPSELLPICRALKQRLVEVGWEVSLELSESSSGAWFVEP